jgi:mannitol/fructose-specific phosphotransferase system IIA component (Ntr-type)
MSWIPTIPDYQVNRREDGTMADMFISYTSSDRDWAFWIGHELESLGHKPRVHDWEIPGGGDIMAWMEERHEAADHILCVISKNYFKKPYSTWERRAAQWAAATQRPGFALPVYVEPCKTPTLFAPLKRCELYGVDETVARARLTAFLDPAGKPSNRIPFPGRMKRTSDEASSGSSSPFPGQQALQSHSTKSAFVRVSNKIIHIFTGQRAVIRAGEEDVGATPAAVQISSENGKPRQQIDIQSTFSPDCVVFLTSLKTKEDAIRQLSLYASKICDVSWLEIYKCLMRRESLGTTACEGIAHPHAQITGLHSSCLLIAKISPPINWGGFDGRLTDIISVILVPEGESSMGLQMTVRRLSNDSVVENIRGATNKNTIYELVSAELTKLKLK